MESWVFLLVAGLGAVGAALSPGTLAALMPTSGPVSCPLGGGMHDYGRWRARC